MAVYENGLSVIKNTGELLIYLKPNKKKVIDQLII